MGVGAAASARRKGVIAGFVFVIAGLGATQAMAQSNWTGTASTDWTAGGNWNPLAPQAALGAYINTTTPNSPVISSGNQVAKFLELGTTFGQSGTLTISGGTLTVDERSTNVSVLVGNRGTGTLTISGGATLTSKFSYIAANLTTATGTSSTGTVTVTGAGSSWIINGPNGGLDVGSSGTGTLNVLLGGLVSTTGGIILGNDVGASGTVNVSGASTITAGGAITLGNATNSSGTLHISEGSTVTASSNIVIGGVATATGVATVDGAGSKLTGTAVSVSSVGTLTVTNGGSVVSTVGNGTVNGTATFSGNSSWTIAGNLAVSGSTGGGVLTINSGSSVSAAGTATLGGTTGKIAVNGTGSTLTVAGNLSASAGGTLEATNGGQITLGGISQPQTGTVTVSGTNSKLTITAGIGQFGGNGGTTTVNVTGGGTVVTGVIGNESLGVLPTLAQFGAVAGGTTTVTVSGTGSSWTNYSMMSVGGSGTGSLTVSSGATVYSTRMNVAGSGTGTLTISGGSQVSTQIMIVASDSTTSTGNGTVTVTGANSKLTVTQDNGVNSTFDVGRFGTGRLDVLAGGVVEVKAMTISGGTNGNGTVLISGTGSRLVATRIDVGGPTRQAALTIENGGRLEASNVVTLSGPAATPTIMTINGGTFASTSELNLNRDAQIVASNGAVIQSRASSIGQTAGTDSSVTLSSGSAWTIAQNLTVGSVGKGTLTMTGGSTLRVDTTITVGQLFGSEGTIIARGAGTTITSTTTSMGLRIGGLASPGGRGTVIISDGAKIALAGPATIHTDGLLQIGEGAVAGVLEATSLVVNGELRLNHTGTLTIDAPLSGTGTINKYGTGTSTFTGVSTFTGATHIYGGKLVIGNPTAGSLASSPVFVENGGTLGGIGTIGATTVRAGGIHAPGNSIGTVTINGNYANAGTLEIEVDEFGNSDRVIVNGTVDVSQATLRIVPVSGATWTMNQTYNYTIIDNDGVDAVAPFASVENLAFFTSNVIYNGGTGNDVVLALTRTSATFAQLGSTPNQRATAVGLNSIPSGAALPSALSFLTVAGANPVLDQLSGEIHATVAGVALDLSRLPRDAALSRVTGAFDGNGDGLDYWGRAIGSLGSVDGNGNATAVSTATAGIIAGADGWVTQDLFLGVELGFTQTAIGAPGRSSTASLQTAHLGVYGGASFDNFRARFGGSVSAQGAHVERTPAVTGVNGTLTSNYSGVTALLFGELGYAIELQDVTLEPYVGLTLLTSSMGSYAETGSIAALSGQSAALGTAIATLGLRASTEFEFNGRTGRASAAVGVDSGPGVTPTATHAFAGGSPFSVAGVGTGPRLKLEAGISAPLSESTSLDLSYRGTIGAGSGDSALSVTFSGKF